MPMILGQRKSACILFQSGINMSNHAFSDTFALRDAALIRYPLGDDFFLTVGCASLAS